MQIFFAVLLELIFTAAKSQTVNVPGKYKRGRAMKKTEETPKTALATVFLQAAYQNTIGGRLFQNGPDK